MPVAERRTTITVKPWSHKRHRCQRCKRKVFAGERATFIVVGSQVVIRHAGRVCP